MSLTARGEVSLCDLGMIAKVRPVLIFSVPFGDRDYALFPIVPHTTAARNSQVEVPLTVSWLQPGVFNIQGSQSGPRGNLIRLLGTLTKDQMA